jgi:phosphate:Na+ symporter
VVRAVRDNDQQAAEDVIAVKDDVQRLADQALALQSQRIGASDLHNLEVVRLEFEILDNLRRIYTLAKRIARDFVPEQVAEKARHPTRSGASLFRYNRP